MSSFDFDAIAAELSANTSAEDAQAMMLVDADRIRDRIESRRAIANAQMRVDEIKSKLCDKIQEEKKKVPGLKEKISALEESEPEIYKYIRKLEIIQDGIWCPRCNIQKSIGGRKQDAQVGIEPKTEYDINALHAYESAVLEKLRHDYMSFEDKIVTAFENIGGPQRDFDKRYKNSINLVTALIADLNEMQERAKHIGNKIGQAPNVFMQAPLEHMPVEHTHDMKSSIEQKISLEKINSLPVKPTYNLDSIVEETYSHMSASDLLDDY